MILIVLLVKALHKNKYYLNILSTAKVNLNLRIVGHDSHFHLLQSYFYPIHTLADDIQIRVANSDEITIKRESYIPEFTDTIIVKTIAAMRAKFGFSEFFDVILQKRIPLGGGLGGGSSNAASIINTIDQLLGLGLSIDEKCEVGKTIGADVPFFLYNKPCVVEGFGEVITPIKGHKDYRILLVVPDFGCSTPEVFKIYRASGQSFSAQVSHQELIDQICYNDLTDAACTHNSKIADILSAIGSCKGCEASAMSGSGATCFGVFEDAPDLHNASEILSSQFPHYQIFSSVSQ